MNKLQMPLPPLSTAEAAFLLRRRPNTLRIWACKQCGPVQPIKSSRGGPLRWPRDRVFELAGVSEPERET